MLVKASANPEFEKSSLGKWQQLGAEPLNPWISARATD